MKRVLIILLIICAIAIDINAQTKVYPITVTISGNSNISASLSQLCSPQSTLMFTFQCLDRKESSLPVAVKVRLYPATGKGKSIENQVQMGKKTFDIGFGQTIVEQKTDLEKYFLTNFTNANQSGYYQNGQLVEGSYILQVVCYDARTISRQISNVAKIYLHIDQFNYPTLQFPRNNSDLEEYTTKPTLKFQWLNTGKTDPKIRYKFELWKVINPSSLETYVKQTRPIFVEENLFVTQKSYMPEILNLEIGQKYCWRVTAYDPEKTLSFKRNGESEVFQFQFLNPPVPVTGLKNKILGKQITYTWNTDKSHTKYIVEYYDYKRDTTISAEQTENILKLTAPDYDYRIKFRVKAVCYNDMSRTSDFTPWSEAYVQPENKVEYECGKRFPDREIENQELKTEFFEGEIVESKNGDSRYEIIKAESQGDGSLRGKFYAIMDCWGGAKILCDFWDTKINTDNIVLTTRYKSEDIPGFVADPEEIKKYVNELINNVNMAITDNTIRDTIVINQKFDYLYTENGRFKAVVLDDNGEPNVTDVTPEKSFTQALITDGQGDTAVVSKKGQVMGVKEYQFAGDNRHLLNEYHRQLDSLGEWIIQFDAFDKQDYGFDKVPNKKGIFSGSEYYPYLSANYDLRYKSVECDQNDKVVVDFGSYPEKDSVVFKDKYGITLKLSKKNLLTFTAPNQADTNYIYAYRGDKKIGKLMLNVYKRKPIKVCLVMVNGAHHKESFDEIKNYLDKVFKPAVVEFEITHADFKMSELTSFSHGGSPWHSVYNDDQKRVLRAYNDSIKDGIYYLFFIDNVTDKKDGNGTMVSGYMPRGYNCGFIYDGGSPRTIAHELGHGIAGLEHVFENSSNSGKTQNLMDYADGEELWHFQWDEIQDPSRVWMKWNKDESEGEAYGKNTHFVCIKQNIAEEIKLKAKYFYLPDGKIADYSKYTPSGFYTAEDGSAKTSYGAVACIRENNYDYYFLFSKNNNSQLVANVGYGFRLIGTDTTRHLQFEIKEIESQDETTAARVLIKEKKADLFIGQTLEKSYENAVCDCNMAEFHELSSDDIFYETEDEQLQVMLYDQKKNQIIIIAGISDAKKILKFKNNRTIRYDTLLQHGAEIKEMTPKEFFDSEYNWLKKDMQAYQREASKYVAVGVGVAAALPLLVEAGPVIVQQLIPYIARKYGAIGLKNFLVGGSIDAFSYLVVQPIVGEEIKTSDFIGHFIFGGLANIAGTKYAKISLNCINGPDISDVIKCFATAGDSCNYRKIIFECVANVVCDEVLSHPKVQAKINQLGAITLSKFEPFKFVSPKEELMFYAKSHPDIKFHEEWVNSRMKIIEEYGEKGFEFIKACKIDYKSVGEENFRLISKRLAEDNIDAVTMEEFKTLLSGKGSSWFLNKVGLTKYMSIEEFTRYMNKLFKKCKTKDVILPSQDKITLAKYIETFDCNWKTKVSIISHKNYYEIIETPWFAKDKYSIFIKLGKGIVQGRIIKGIENKTGLNSQQN